MRFSFEAWLIRRSLRRTRDRAPEYTPSPLCLSCDRPLAQFPGLGRPCPQDCGLATL